MFDDLRDLQPTEPGEDPFTGDDLLADLPPAQPDPAQTAVASPFDDPTLPRFGDDVMRTAARRRQRTAAGMTAQQRAVLAVFLFLDVSVLGCVFLLALEKISIP